MGDPAFTNFISAFAEMLQACFGLFKPSAIEANNPPPYRFSIVVKPEGYRNLLLAPGLMIIFKILIELLLFKLLIGVISESYKKNRPPGFERFPTLQHELYELFVDAIDYYFWHKVKGEPYVDFRFLTMACYQRQQHMRKNRKARGHEDTDMLRLVHERIVGFRNNTHCPSDAVKKTLKKAQESLQAKIVFKEEEYLNKNFTEQDAVWCLRKYGITRSKALKNFEQWYVQHLKKREQRATFLSKTTTGVLEGGRGIDEHTAKMWEGLSQTLSDTVSNQPDLTQSQIDEAFTQLDLFCVGFIDIRHVDHVLCKLGHNLSEIDPESLRSIIAEYDPGQTLLYNRFSFYKLVQDDRMKAVYRVSKGAHMKLKQPKHSTQWTVQVAARVLNIARRSNRLTSRTTSNGSTSPLLDPIPEN